MLYTMSARGPDEYLIALDLTQTPPVQKWAEKIGPTFTGGIPFNKGPSTAPTVADGRVYALGGGGDLIGVTTAGKFLWRVALVKDLKGAINPIANQSGTLAWGYAGSPLVDGDKVICVPGGPNGTVAALDAKKGDVIWRSKELTESATYTSPVLATIGGTKQYVVMVQDGVAGIGTDGGLLWRHKRADAYDENSGFDAGRQERSRVRVRCQGRHRTDRGDGGREEVHRQTGRQGPAIGKLGRRDDRRR